MFRLVCRIGLVWVIGWASSGQALAQLFLRSQLAADEPTDPWVSPRHELQRSLAEAQDQLRAGEYSEAIANLQRLLEEPEDYFLQPQRGDKPVAGEAGLTSLKREARRLLAGMPAEGRKAYELLQGIAARNDFLAARERDDVEAIAALVRRAPLTAAGLEAQGWLADRAFDEGRFLEAARAYELLAAQSVDVDRKPLLAVRAAVAAWQAGRRDVATQKIREARSSAGSAAVQVAGRDVEWFARPELALGWLKEFVPPVTGSVVPAEAWMMSLGNAARNGVAAEVSPAGGARWRISTLAQIRPDVSPERTEQFRELLQQSLRSVHDTLQAERVPAIPSAQPLVAGDRIVFRTINDVTCVDARTGTLLWRGTPTNPEVRRAVRAIESAAGETALDDFRLPLEGLLRATAYQDQATGTLSSDGRFIYALEEPQVTAVGNAGNVQPAGEQLVNRLVAYDVRGGRVAWEIGGRRSQQDPTFSGAWFLGAPLPIDDRLYVLCESSGEVRLLSLSSTERGVALEWSQQLMAPDAAQDVSEPSFRRWTSLSPSWSEGLLVCPTSAGAVVGYDPHERILRWMYQYESDVGIDALRRRQTQGMPAGQAGAAESPLDVVNRWQDDSALIVGDRVLLTPRDSALLHCVDLERGELVWSRPREDGLYAAGVHDGLLLVIGRGSVRTVRLDDGSEAWAKPLTVPLPAGRGLHLGDRYLLPLSTGELLTLDVSSGRVLARSRLPGEALPGNLAAGGGRLVSLSADDLLGFTPLDDLEQEIAAGLQQDPRDAAALARRGELRLQRGDEAGGLRDLRDSLAMRDDQHVKSVLAGVMLDAIKADFDGNRSLVPEVEALSAPGPQRDELLRLLVDNLERRGERLEAFQVCLRLVQNAGVDDGLVTVSPDWMVRRDRAVRGRFLTLLAGLPAADRAAADSQLRQLLAAGAESDRPGEWRRWLWVLGDLPDTLPWQEQAALANSPAEDGLAWGRAWSKLAESSAGKSAGPALARLAARAIELRRFDAAEIWIRRLETEFADQVCLDEKTGQQLAAGWRTLPDFQQATTGPLEWPGGEAELRRVVRRLDPVVQTMPVPIVSRSDEYRRWSFEISFPDSGPQLNARDGRGFVAWSVPLPGLASQFRGSFAGPEEVFARVHGEVLILIREKSIEAFDVSAPQKPRPLWTHSLDSKSRTKSSAQRVIVTLGGGRQTYRNSPGDVLGVTADEVIYGIGSELGALDLATGRTEWVRYDAPSWTSAFVNDEQILLTPPAAAVAPIAIPLAAFRVADGAPLPQRRLPRGELLWAEGCRVLLLEDPRRAGQREPFPNDPALPDNSRQILQLVDLIRGEAVWSRELTSAGRPCVESATGEILVVDAAGELTSWGLNDGELRWKVPLPLKFPAPAVPLLLAQPQGDRLLLLCGTNRPDEVRVLQDARPQSVAMEATAIMLDARTHELLWHTPLGWNSFEPDLAPWSPILFAASRQFHRGGTTAGPRLAMAMLDKRTGRKLYESSEAFAANSFVVDCEPGTRDLEIRMMNWSFQVHFADETP